MNIRFKALVNLFQLKKLVIDPISLPNSRETVSKVLVTVSSSYTLINLMCQNIQPHFTK